MKEQLKGFTRMASLFVVGVALIAVYKTFDNFSFILAFIDRLLRILSPFVVGLGMAVLLYAPVSRIEKRLAGLRFRRIARRARALAVLAVYLILLLILAVLVVFAIPALVRGVMDFAAALPGYYAQLTDTLNSLSERFTVLQGFDMTETAEKVYTEYIQPRLTTKAILSYFQQVMDFTSSLLNVFMSVIISIYMLLGRESLVRASQQLLGLFIPARAMEKLADYTHRSCAILYSYLYSQMLDALIVGVLMSIGLGALRAPSAPLLGFTIGLMNLIPYFGSIIGGVLAVAVTLLSGKVYTALFAAAYIIVMQQLDANLIQPRIVGDKVGVRPLYVLLAITLFGGLFGFWGIFFGVPAIAIVQMLLRDYIAYRHSHPGSVKERFAAAHARGEPRDGLDKPETGNAFSASSHEWKRAGESPGPDDKR